MKRLLTLKNGQDIVFRPVGVDRSSPNAQQDYKYCYDLAKRTVMEDIIKVAGEWPEQQQQEFFSSDFYQDDTYILECGGKRIGCFGIHEDDESITLCKSYIEPAFQGCGIWTKHLNMALEIANNKRKPLQMAVLKSNTDMHDTALRYKFIETEGFVMHEDASWVRMHILTHKDTLQYQSQVDIFLSPE